MSKNVGCGPIEPRTETCGRADAEQFMGKIHQVVPPGWAWDALEDTESTMYRRLEFAAYQLAEIENRACELLREFRCHSNLVTRDEWNADFGLPDDCGINDICLKLAYPGGQSIEYFLSLGQYLGYHDPGPTRGDLEQELELEIGQLDQLTITEHRPFTFGLSRFADRRWQFAPPEMRFVWTVTVPGKRLTWFRFGVDGGRLGKDPHLTIDRAEDLECLFHKLKPAHTNLVFAYTGV